MCLSLGVGSPRTQHLCFIENTDTLLKTAALGAGKWRLFSLYKSFSFPGGIQIILGRT